MVSKGLIRSSILCYWARYSIIWFAPKGSYIVGLSIWLSDNLGSHIAIGHKGIELSQIVSDEDKSILCYAPVGLGHTSLYL